MQRPIGVTLTTILMATNLFVDLIHPFFSKTLVVPQTTHTPHHTAVTIILHVALFGFEAIQALAILFYWLGRPWARWLVLGGCVLYLTSLKDLHLFWHHAHFATVTTLAAGALAVFLLWYLHTRHVRQWFSRAAASAKRIQRPAST